MSDNKNSPHWAELQESTVVAGMWFLYAVDRYVGRWLFQIFVYPAVLYYWLTGRVARQSSMLYLQRLHAAMPAMGTPPRWYHSVWHFFSFAETVMDKMLAMSGRFPSSRIEVHDKQIITTQIRARQGGVIVTAHIGCLELCQVMAAQEPELRINIIVHTGHAVQFNRMLARLDMRKHLNFIEVTDFDAETAMALLQRVEAGEFIAIVGDRVPVASGRCVEADFLQHKAPFPIGPYVLAAMLGCPVFLMASVKMRGKYHVFFERLADRIVLPRGNREQALAGYARQFAAWIEQRLMDAPYSWFNFFPFWDQAAGTKQR